MKFLATILLIAGQLSFAATTMTATSTANRTTTSAITDSTKKTGFLFSMDLSLNGKHVGSPRISVLENQQAEISQGTEGGGTYFVSVIAKEATMQNQKGIMMSLEVGTTAKDGTRTVISKPEIFAKENTPAKMTNAKADGTEEMALTITAKKQTF